MFYYVETSCSFIIFMFVSNLTCSCHVVVWTVWKGISDKDKNGSRFIHYQHAIWYLKYDQKKYTNRKFMRFLVQCINYQKPYQPTSVSSNIASKNKKHVLNYSFTKHYAHYHCYAKKLFSSSVIIWMSFLICKNSNVLEL